MPDPFAMGLCQFYSMSFLYAKRNGGDKNEDHYLHKKERKKLETVS